MKHTDRLKAMLETADSGMETATETLVPVAEPEETSEEGRKRALSDMPVIPEAVYKQAKNLAGASTTADVVDAFNKDHFVVFVGGKTMVAREVRDPETGEFKLDFMAFRAFRELYSNEYLQVGDVKKCVADIFLRSPDRREYKKGLEFRPRGNPSPGYYNLWRGYGWEPQAGAAEIHVKPFLGFLRRVICGKDREAYEYLLGWLARAVQHPELQGEVAVVMIGSRGTGKSTLGRWFSSLFGAHGKQVTQSRHLTGNFNAHLESTAGLFVDEAFFAGDKAGNSVLKALITEPKVMIERKFLDTVERPNRLKIMMATNSSHAVIAGTDERRYLVLEVSDIKKQDHSYFAGLNNWWQLSGGKEAVLGYLLSYDISDFNIRKVPNTDALGAQKLASLAPLDRWWYERLQVAGRWKVEWGCEQACNEFKLYCEDRQLRYENTDPTSVSMRLRKLVEIKKKRSSEGARKWIWAMPELDEARRQFQEAVDVMKIAWGDEDEDEEG